MRVALAQTRFPQSVAEAIVMVNNAIRAASEQNCHIICFPESVIPGLRGVGYEVEDYNHDRMKEALEEVRCCARDSGVAVILPMEWKDEYGTHLVAFVISETGKILGYQTKNQYDPEEDVLGYTPGTGREMFEIKGVQFGIVICHEGWRYPETVRWAALRGARIVFHPQFTGTVANPEFFSGAMVCRSLENNIYFASVNYALESSGTVTTLVSPCGERLFVAGRGQEELLVGDINPQQAHRLLAERFNPKLV